MSVTPSPGPLSPSGAVSAAPAGRGATVAQVALELCLVAAGVALILAGQLRVGLGLLSAALTAGGLKLGLPVVLD